LKALIDGDILLYEIGFSCQGVDQETGEQVITTFDNVKERVDLIIERICRGAGADSFKLYLTGKGNFREEIAKKKGYKAQRKAEKPFHYANIKGYLIAQYQAEVCEGYEADDAVCIAQYAALRAGESTIICSRDKDVKQAAGWHYSWECGLQPEWGPYWVEGFGELFPSYYPEDHKLAGQMKKLLGTGDKWFLAQLLMGDSVDNIPGLSGWGPSKVFNLLENVTSYKEGINKVIRSYDDYYSRKEGLGLEKALEQLKEQAALVWMVRERNEDGSLKHWRVG
jgi:5'-3' exonuclease